MKKSILLLAGALVLASCSDFLTRTPEASFNSETYFRNEGSLKTYANGFIQKYTPGAVDFVTSDVISDITVSQASSTFLTADWDADKQGGWSSSDWNMLYNVNWFLANFRKTPGVSEEVLNHYEGTARFWRAYFYFEKVKTFGDVPWYEQPIDADDEEALYKGRDSRDLVMSKVLEDLNFACEHLYGTDEWCKGAQINKWIALAFKSKVCLYEGTFRKYHSVNPSTQQPWEDSSLQTTFLNECIKACDEIIKSGRFTIVTGNPKTAYRDLFTKEAVNRNEVIWAREYNAGLNIGHEITWRFAVGSYGTNYGGTRDFIKTFLNLDGSRHDEAVEDFATEMTGRDYRLTQIFMGPDYTKTVGSTTGVKTAPNCAVAPSGFHICKFTLDDTAYESAAISNNSIPLIRYAEVLLNYAEAKWEMGQFGATEWNLTIKPLRERAGVAGDIPASADPFLAAYYGMNDMFGLEIRRERAIELYLEGSRVDDIYRWHKGELLTKEWKGIYIPEVNTPFDLNNDGKPDVCYYTDKAGSESGVTYVKLNNTCQRGADGYLLWNIERKWKERNYVRPIPRKALVVNPNLGQNKLWEE